MSRNITVPGHKVDQAYTSAGRTSTGNAAFPDNLEGVNSAIKTIIKQSFDDDKVNKGWFSPEFFSFLFPRDETDLKLWQKFLGSSMSLSIAELVKIFDLVPAVAEPTESGHEFYLRIFQLERKELEDMFCSWETKMMFFEEVGYWTYFLKTRGHKKSEDYDAPVNIMYVGQVTGGSSPLDRYIADLKERNSGIFAKFISEFIELDNFESKAQVFRFKNASLEFDHQEAADLRERALIALFGKRTLLNRQEGGHYASYKPSEMDKNLFFKQNIDFFSQFRKSSRYPRTNSNTVAAVGEWASRIRQYAEENPQSTGNVWRALTDQHMSAYKEQVTPALVNGQVLVMLLGKDITLEDFNGAKAFFGGASRAATITRDYLARYAALEEDGPATSWDARDITPANAMAMFPFLDFWPWMRHKDEDFLANTMCFLVRSLNPFVLVSFSRFVSSVAAANFGHTHGFSSQNFLDHVGVPRLCFTEDAEWRLTDRNEPSEDFVSIQIPHIDPGREKYGSRCVELRRVMDLTWIVTLKIASTALTYITQARRGPALQRKEACKHIMSTAMAEMEATGLREALDQAKKDLHRRWSVMNLAAAKTMSDDERESRRLGVYKMIEESDFADGEPNSVLRLRQVSYLYNLNLPTLHIHISSAPDQTAKWFEWACGLPSGKSYYMSALASKEPIERLLRQFAPPDAKDDSWMQNPGQRALALDAAGARLKAGLSSDHFSSANQRNRVLQRWKGSTLDTTAKDSLNGEKISMQAGGAFLLYWLRGGQTVRIEFRAPRSLVPKTKEDERFIFFTEFGIDIRNGDGKTLVGDKAGFKTTTFRAQAFVLMNCAEAITALWEAETGLTLAAAQDDSRSDTDHAHPKDFYTPKGHAFFKSGTGAKKIDSHPKPPHTGDALWLLNEFLNDKFPTGGTLRTGAPAFFQAHAAENFWLLFGEFIQRPLYANHPYLSHWAGLVETTRASDIKKNLQFCRDITGEGRKQVFGRNSVFYVFEGRREGW